MIATTASKATAPATAPSASGPTTAITANTPAKANKSSLTDVAAAIIDAGSPPRLDNTPIIAVAITPTPPTPSANVVIILGDTGGVLPIIANVVPITNRTSLIAVADASIDSQLPPYLDNTNIAAAIAANGIHNSKNFFIFCGVTFLPSVFAIASNVCPIARSTNVIPAQDAAIDSHGFVDNFMSIAITPVIIPRITPILNKSPTPNAVALSDSDAISFIVCPSAINTAVKDTVATASDLVSTNVNAINSPITATIIPDNAITAAAAVLSNLTPFTATIIILKPAAIVVTTAPPRRTSSILILAAIFIASRMSIIAADAPSIAGPTPLADSPAK